MTTMSESEKIERILKSIKPAFASGLRFQLDDDATGDPAVWVWLIVADEKLESPAFQSELEAFQSQVGETLRADGIERWPYVRLESISDQAEKP